MVKQRIQELIDFATTESPYRSANKGWINEDVYLAWGRETQSASIQPGNEIANVSVLWKPINQILLILFSVVILATILVFLAVSFSHGKLNFSNTNSQGEVPKANISVATSKIQLNSESAPLNSDKIEKDTVVAIEEKEIPKINSNRPELKAEVALSELNETSPRPKEFSSTKRRKAKTAVDLFQSKHK